MKFDIPFKERSLAAFQLFVFALIFAFSGVIAVDGQAPAVVPDVNAKSVAAGTTAPEKPASAAIPSPAKIKVVFDEKTPGVVYVESNGERIRIDTTSKTVDQDTADPKDNGSPKTGDSNAAATGPMASATPAAKDNAKSKYDFDKGEEPYDFRVVNIPAPKNVPKHTFNLVFTHRFTQPIHPLMEDSTFSDALTQVIETD